MAKVFVSYTVANGEVARRIAGDLRDLGHEVFFDEWSIPVGDSIVSSVNQGLKDAEYVVILLSKDSVQSVWMQREWQSKFYEEVKRNQIMLLPALLEDCDVPALLADKKYADFRTNYALGLAALATRIAPTMGKLLSAQQLPSVANGEAIASLLSTVQSQNTSLADCLVTTLTFAQKIKDPGLSDFCRHELAGWTAGEDAPDYRLVDGFLSLYEINPSSLTWAGSSDNVFRYMRQNPKEFKPYKAAIGEPVASMEAAAVNHPGDGLFTIRLRWADIFDNATHPDAPCVFYAEGHSYSTVIRKVREELTRRLIGLLPRIDVP